MKKKKAPKSSSKKRRKLRELRENIIVFGVFVIFILVVAYLYYFMNIFSNEDDVVAVVNGNEITRNELDWWYKISVFPEDRDVITRHDFLMLSLIPQEVVVQKAKEEGIKVTEEDVEKLVGLFIIENGLTLDEFEMHLNSRGITINDIKKSFETRAVILNLMEEENLDEDEYAFREYVDDLINSSEIEIFPENVEKIVLRSFEETGDKLCDEEKPVIRLYTTSWCEVCEESGKVFEDLVKDLVGDGSIKAYHWSLDTGDDLLTLKKESGVPEKEVELFKKYSPKSLVPTVVIGCKYKRVGSFGAEEEDEFKAILKNLIA